ncbi:hypothetical protein D3C86_1577620 [compost metagenome]
MGLAAHVALGCQPAQVEQLDDGFLSIAHVAVQASDGCRGAQGGVNQPGGLGVPHGNGEVIVTHGGGTDGPARRGVNRGAGVTLGVRLTDPLLEGVHRRSAFDQRVVRGAGVELLGDQTSRGAQASANEDATADGQQGLFLGARGVQVLQGGLGRTSVQETNGRALGKTRSYGSTGHSRHESPEAQKGRNIQH